MDITDVKALENHVGHDVSIEGEEYDLDEWRFTLKCNTCDCAIIQYTNWLE